MGLPRLLALESTLELRAASARLTRKSMRHLNQPIDNLRASAEIELTVDRADTLQKIIREILSERPTREYV
jgi:ribose 5-phosphate isomerase